jgi:hypothetical protein
VCLPKSWTRPIQSQEFGLNHQVNSAGQNPLSRENQLGTLRT